MSRCACNTIIYDFDKNPWQLGLIEKYFEPPRIGECMRKMGDGRVRPTFPHEQSDFDIAPSSFVVVSEVRKGMRGYIVSEELENGNSARYYVVDDEHLMKIIRYEMNATL